MPPCDTSEAVRWLIDGASTTILPEKIVQQLCERMIAGGVPLAGAAVFIQTLHPELFGRCFVWRQGFQPMVLEFPYESRESIALQRSVEAGIRPSDRMVSLDPEQEDSSLNLEIFRSLRAPDVKAFVATPIVFSDGEMHLAVWTTRQPGGFTAEQMRGIENIVGPLSRFSEIYALRRRATVLLDTYVGHAAGERILAGRIRRGHTDALHAAIWLSDMRGFTELADRLPPRILIDLLNRYFDCQVPAVTRRGGEVLKFMGDGMLAVFPISEDDGDAKTVCNQALAAAYDARTAVAAIERGLDGERGTVRFGVALHLGSVLYGNIGGERRLDF